MTAATENATGQTVNGQAPATDDGYEPVPASERIMGIIGVLFALGILAIGIDLATGGALSSLFARDSDDAG